MISYLMIVKLRSIINDQNYREPKAIYDMLPQKKKTLCWWLFLLELYVLLKLHEH